MFVINIHICCRSGIKEDVENIEEVKSEPEVKRKKKEKEPKSRKKKKIR